jgi:heme exporter protein C
MALWSGIALLVAGLAVTIASYASARPGDRYVVATGLVIVGVVQIARGAATRRLDGVFYALLAVTALVFVGEVLFIFLRVPTETRMGIVQKIFYFHVPSWYGMYLGAGACFLGSLTYLVRATDGRDAFARAGAEVAVVFGAIGLITGPLWGAKAWGTFWTWDPRLTTALLSFLIYVAYLVLRAFAGDGAGERRFSAALGVIGAANLPIIHYSVQKWGGQHPTVITNSGGGLQHPDMKTALAGGFLCFTLMAALMLWARARVELARSRLARAEADAVDLGLDTRTEA